MGVVVFADFLKGSINKKISFAGRKKDEPEKGLPRIPDNNRVVNFGCMLYGKVNRSRIIIP
jgi:hypothetical protein